MIPWASSNQISCICLPAGFFLLKSLSEHQNLLSEMTRSAWEYGVSFILGMDKDKPILRRRPNSPAFLETVRKQAIPTYIYAYNALKDEVSISRQRSCTSTHSYLKLVPDEIMLTPRAMNFGELDFQIIHCGEVYDPRLFSPDMPKAGIVFGHKTMPRLSRSLRYKSMKGFSLINTEHRWQSGGMLFCYNDGDNLSVQSHNLIDSDADGIWIDIALWRLCKDGRFVPVKITPDVLTIEA
jgi:hypothetical protein